MNAWRITLLAIHLSIWPPKNGTAPECPAHAADRVGYSRVRAILAHLDAHLDSSGQFALRIPDCHPVAAPFLLFRLKREGYSDCRVVHENGGLTVRARR